MADAERVVADRYLLHEPVGRGGMGVVWRADDQLLGRHVAVKEVNLQPGLSAGEREAVQARVLREARAAAMLNHAGAVTVYDVAEEGGQAYIVMELVDAPTLAELVRDHGPLPPAEVARIGLAVLDVLVAAHASGIVHRDLKPGNVMVAGDRVKLTDFGIATIKDDPRLTSTGIVLGSPSYISPEQARGEPVTAATDLWGLGATLFFGACGRPPFDRGEAIATLTAVAHDELQVDACAGPLAPLLQAMLAKDPTQRPGVADLRARLSALAEGREAPATVLPADVPTIADPALPPPVRAAAPADPAPTLATEATVVEPVAEPAEPPAPTRVDEPRPVARPVRTARRRSRAPWVLATIVLLLAAAVAGARLAADRPGGLPGLLGGDGDTSASGGTAAGAVAVPAGWASYTHPDAGYTVRYPQGWSVQRRDRWTTDFREPGTGRYLRVGWTDTPGDDPVGAWRSFSKAFAGRHGGYEEVRIDGATYRGHEAAVWEYRYREGTALHAVDLGFVTADRGYALNFQTHEDDWARSQELFEQLKAGFRIP
ncbi:MAG TPA: serine/threonine-protein kinase [Mycobacteriales bacterium]|jgi:hypothetical protein|nr:serine/threonine-protein kinase [Mycobacteriales bacterium]